MKKVLGVENNASALKDAQINQKINGITNAEFILADAGKYMKTLSKNRTGIDAVIMDPPRAGSDTRFMSSLVKMRPDRVVYVSCNPATLKRDLQYLHRYYQVEMIQPVDMFPFTGHVEAVVCLNNKKTKRREHAENGTAAENNAE